MTTVIGTVGSRFGRVAVGHPIDVASGEFFATDVDHELPGAVPLSLGRRYSTRSVARPLLGNLGAPEKRWCPFGPGWRATWFAELRSTMSGFVYTRADGVEFSIRDPDGDASLARTGRIFSSADGLELRRISDSHVRIIGYGRDRNRFTLLFERWSGVRYRLVSIERTREARVDIVYDLAGRPSRLVQRRERRSYELVHEGERVIRAVLHLADRSSRVVAQYAYDARGRLVGVHDDRGMASAYAYDDRDRIVHDEKRGGSVYTVRYGHNGRCEYAAGTDRYQERSLHYDLDARTTRVADSRGNVTSYEWNEQGQVIRSTTPCGEVSSTLFDELGRPFRQTLETGEVREQVYDELGRVIRERQHGEPDVVFHYDGEHRLVALEEVLDGDVVARVRYTHDADHNVTSVQLNEAPAWRYTWNAFGELATTTSPSGATAAREYDELGGLSRAANFDGHSWRWTRDAIGRVLTETDPLGHSRRVEYLDPDGRSVRMTEPDGRVYTREASVDGRLTVFHLPGGATRVVELSSCGTPVRIQDEIGAVTTLRWGTEPSELRTITDANGAEYIFDYDADMRLVGRRTFDGRTLETEWKRGRIAASVDGLGGRTEYEYDLGGRISRSINADGTTSLIYDSRGHLEAITTPSAALRFQRDDLGRIVSEEQDGIRLERELDAMGRILSHVTPFGVASAFSWTAAGACKSIRYGETEVRFERDALGRETRRHLGAAGTFEQAYDPVGRLVSQAFYGGDRPSASDKPTLARHFGFDARGFLSSIEDSLRGHTRLLHNERGDLTGVVRERGLSDFYMFDACQNRVYSATTEHGAALAAALERASRDRATLGEVSLDLLAARFPHIEQSQSYVRGNRVVSLSRSDGSRTDLTYDSNGQVIAKVITSGPERHEWRYGWNARGELATLTTPNGKAWSYRYDGVGRRIEKRSPTGDTWRYVWMGTVLVQTLKNGELVETYVHEPGGGCPILRDDGQVHYILPDQNESPSEEIGAAGQLEWQTRKGTWGEHAGARGATGGEPFLGQWFDAESGLHYNFFRYYDPEVGRYLSPDPIGLLGGLNIYSATSSPESRYDRLGLSESCGPQNPAPNPRSPPEDDDGPTTRLWRAVEPDELKDVKRYGDYDIHPNSTFKRFAFKESDLDDFMTANPDRSYTKTYVDIPTDKLQFMFAHADPGGVGQAVGIDVYDNPEFYKWFKAPVRVVS